MNVDFNFGATAEITLTPESPREESLVKMCYEQDNDPMVLRNGDNKIRIKFTNMINVSTRKDEVIMVTKL